jgi:Ca2+-binding EF-hand superfamily protein
MIHDDDKDEIDGSLISTATKLRQQFPNMDMASATPLADQVFIQIFQECLLPRGLRPHDLFNEIDADNSGEITLEEFRAGLFAKFSIELTDKEFAAVCIVADADGSGDIALNELVQILQRGESAEAGADRIFHELWQTLTLKGMKVTTLFHHCDEDGSGEIDLDELRKGMDVLLGIQLTEHEFRSISAVADKDGSGDISVKELVRIVARGDKKRQEFRREYSEKMKQQDMKNSVLRVPTPVTPTSDYGDDDNKKLIMVDGMEFLRDKTPSPVEGMDMMGMARYGPENELSQPVVRPTVWGKTGRLRIHKPPAARRKEWKKAVGRPDLWHLKLRQQNYIPEQILSAPNRPTNRVQVATHRSRAIEIAAAAAKAYQDGPPAHGTLEPEKRGMSLVEKAARNQLFGELELQDLAMEVRQRAMVVNKPLKCTAASSTGASGSGVNPSPPSPTSGLEDYSTMSGGSAIPAGYGPGGGLGTASTTTTYKGIEYGINHPGHTKMSGHMLQMSEPLYWRKRVKHPSALHRIRNAKQNPQLCYTSRMLTPRDNLKGTNSHHWNKNNSSNSARTPKPPSSSSSSNSNHSQQAHHAHRELTHAEEMEHLTEVHEHLALEDASFVIAREQAKDLRDRLKQRQKTNFAKALYLGEPAALRKAVLIAEQNNCDSDQFDIYLRRTPKRPDPKPGTNAYLRAQEKSRRAALHTECAGYTKSKRNTQKAANNPLTEEDAKEEYYGIQEFEKRQIKQGHTWEPTTGKDWHREQRFLKSVLQRHTKDPALAQGFTQFRKDYKRKSKNVLKRVADKGYEYVRAMHKLHFRTMQMDNEEDLTQKTARHRWRKGNVGIKMQVRGEQIRERAIKEREARLLSLRNFSGFGRRHLEFISEQLYMSIMRMPQPPGKVKKPMQIVAEAFDAIDEDLSGSINSQEFSAAMMRLDLGLSKDAIDELLQVIDNDGDGEVDKVEFLATMKYVHQKLTRMTYDYDSS